MRQPVSVMMAIVFGLLLLWGMVTDVRHRRVPNALVGMLALTGCIAALLDVTPLTLPMALAGLGTGLVLWLPLWLFGLLGAGDVKYFAAGSAWLGPTLALQSALGVTVVGGVMAALLLMRRFGAREGASVAVITGTQARTLIQHAASHGGVAGLEARQRTFPYAVPMGLVLWVAFYWPAVFAW